MAESLLCNKNAVMETFVLASFFEWEADQTDDVKIKILSLRNDIASKVFWDEVGDVYHVMMPIML